MNERDYKWWKLYGAQPWETDRYAVEVNGHAVKEWSFIRRHRFENDFWIWGIRFDVPAAWLEAGENAVLMRMENREPQIAWGLVFVDVALLKR